MRVQHGDVVIRVSKRKPYNPFCGLDWQLSDEIDLTSPHIHVMAPPFSSRVTLAAAGGAQLTSVFHRSGDASGYLTWQGHAYRCTHESPVHLTQPYVCNNQYIMRQQVSATPTCNMSYRLQPACVAWDMSRFVIASASSTLFKHARSRSLYAVSGMAEVLCTCCRWESVGHMAPLLLKLTDVKSGQHMASLQGSTSMPWRKEQQRISIFAGREDPVWLQLVIASGLAEAKWRGGENSCTAPRRSGCSR